MSGRQRGRYRIILARCAACGDHVPVEHTRMVRRVYAPGEVQMCSTCWQDALQASRSGGYDLGALLEDLASNR